MHQFLMEYHLYLVSILSDSESGIKHGDPFKRNINMCRLQSECNDHSRFGWFIGSNRYL